MQYDILLTRQPNDGYLARPIQLPEIVVTGVDEADALTRVRAAIVDKYAQSRVVRIDVPIPDVATADPWLRFAGEWGDEAEWAQFQTDIDAFRQEIDSQPQTPHEQ